MAFIRYAPDQTGSISPAGVRSSLFFAQAGFRPERNFPKASGAGQILTFSPATSYNSQQDRRIGVYVLEADALSTDSKGASIHDDGHPPI
jgi:hypothetical protein